MCSRPSSTISPRFRRRHIWCRCSIHGGARACVSRRGKKGQEGQALGRSRGSFSTKMHLRPTSTAIPSPSTWPAARRATRRAFPSCSGLVPMPIRGDRRQGLRQQCQPPGRARPRHLSRHSPQRNEKEKPAFFATTLYKGRPHRAGYRQAQALQARRHTLRKDETKLRILRRSRRRLNLAQIRPHDLAYEVPLVPRLLDPCQGAMPMVPALSRGRDGPESRRQVKILVNVLLTLNFL